MPIEYKTGKIYKVKGPTIIVEEVAQEPKCYIGSTADKLSSRMNGHRNAYKIYLRTKKGKCTIFDLFDEYGVENCKIELIENFECETVDQLKRREGEIQEQTEHRVNHNIAGRTLKETYEASNKKNLIVSICECGGKMSNINKKKHFRSKKHTSFFTTLDINSDTNLICHEINFN